MAKDHFAHVGAYIKYIDKIEQLKKGVTCTYLLIDIIFIWSLPMWSISSNFIESILDAIFFWISKVDILLRNYLMNIRNKWI